MFNGTGRSLEVEGAYEVTTFTQTPVERSEASPIGEPVAEQAATVEPREQFQSVTPRQRRRRPARLFVFGFIVGAVVTAATGIFRRMQMPVVLGNSNTFVSLPFSGITLTSPVVANKSKGKGRRMFALAALNSIARSSQRARRKQAKKAARARRSSAS